MDKWQADALRRASDSDDLTEVEQRVSALLDRRLEQGGAVLSHLRKARGHLVMARQLIDDEAEGWEE